MAGNKSYFGVALGQAINAGAGHISDAIQRKYEMQARQDQMDRQNYQQELANRIALESKGVSVPNVPQSQNFSPMGLNQPMKFPDLSQLHQDYISNRDLEKRKTEAEIAKMGQGPKAPTDFRWTTTGDLEPIPGSKTDFKTQEAKTKKYETQQAFISDIDNALTAIKGAKENVGYLSTGMLGGKLDSTPQAGRLESYLRTINSLIGLDKLKEMKMQSATGASGFGQLSGPELMLLTSSIASLDRKILDPKTMEKNLSIIEDKVSQWKARTMEKMGQSDGGGNTPVESAAIALPADKAKRLLELRAKHGVK